MRIALYIAGVVLVLTAVVVACAMRSPATATSGGTPQDRLLGTATFVVLALTLCALIIYAYDTNTIARVTRDRWKREGVLATAYSLLAVEPKGGPGRTLFRIHNRSTLVVRAKVKCGFRVYGEAVDGTAEFSGTTTWYVFPQEDVQGWFELQDLLQKKGKSVAQLVAERTPGNRCDQLKMSLQVEFRDELGERRILPSRDHFFEFAEWRWVPVLTMQDDWVA